MRTATKSGVTLKYPDEVGFAFNPCIFIATGNNIVSMQLNMSSDGTDGSSVLYRAFGDGCYADVREYVQTFFDTMSFGVLDYTKVVRTEMGKTVTIVVSVTLASGTEVEFDLSVFYIWGALKEGGQETYNGYRTLTWFRGFPFSVGLFSLGGSLLLCCDDMPTRFETIEKGVYNVPLLATDKCEKYFTILDCTGTFVEVTYDKTFDMTFRYTGGGTKTEKVRINVVEDYDEGYYLRWVDRHGFYSYYLFKAGDESRKTEADDAFSRNNLLAYDMSYGYQGYTGRQQQMSREDTVPVCAPNVDSETFEMLFDLATSPRVDLFAGYDDKKQPKWIAVTIQAGTYKKSTAVLQDFTCNVVLPEVPIQNL